MLNCLLTTQHHSIPSILRPYLRGWKPENHTPQNPLVPMFPAGFHKWEAFAWDFEWEREAEVFLLLLWLWKHLCGWVVPLKISYLDAGGSWDHQWWFLAVLETLDFLKGRGKRESWPLLFCSFLLPSVLGLLFLIKALLSSPVGWCLVPLCTLLTWLISSHILAAAVNDSKPDTSSLQAKQLT